MPILARSVPKPLKVPSLARSVPIIFCGAGCSFWVKNCKISRLVPKPSRFRVCALEPLTILRYRPPTQLVEKWSEVKLKIDNCFFVLFFKFSCQKKGSLARTVLKPSHAIDLLPSWLWMKWKWKVKWSLFGPLFFLKLIYIIDHIYTFIATRGKCAQQLSYGFNILDKLESCPHENQIPYGDMVFSKKVSKVIDFR